MKKILAAVMASALVASPTVGAATLLTEDAVVTVPYNASVDTSKNYEPTTEELENMIKLVKPKLNVPEECTEFDWNFNAATYYNQATWFMTWFDKEYTKEISVSCDTHGNIVSYSIYNYNSDRSFKLPAFSKSELEETANGFLEKLAPDAASHMKLESSYSSGFYAKNYVYNYVRYENGVIVPDNTAYVKVDYITGEPTEFSITYNRYVTFDSQQKTDAETAKALLTDAQSMKLSYKLKTEFDDQGNRTGRKAYLIYTPEESYLSVDAETGKVYDERNTWNVLEKGSATGGVNNFFGSMLDSTVTEESIDAEYRLTDEELAQLDVLEGLITREEAIKVITENEALYLDETATAVEAQLRQVYSYDYYRPVNNAENLTNDNYRWNITFSAPYNSSKENGYYSPSVHATVDAQTGALISFSSSLPGNSYYTSEGYTGEIPELVYTEENATEIFTAFARQLIPEYVDNSRVADVSDSVVYKYVTNEKGDSIPVYRASNVNMIRVNEGVDFLYNGVYGSVDLVTGKITSFSYDWYDDVVFESPEDAISPEEAYRVMLDSDGFGLNYEINSNYTYHKYLADEEDGYVDYDALYTTEQYTRLVYSGYDYLSTTVSALIGELISYSGTPVTRETETVYTDISGHWAENDIITITDLGFSFEGTEFKPDSFITYSEYVQLMQFFNKYVYQSAVNDSDKDNPITRTQAVKHIIDAAGYYSVAAMTDIFITDFADNSELLREDVGFIAIARGFGLVQGNLGEFRPYDNITRAEAVTLILNFIKILN